MFELEFVFKFEKFINFNENLVKNKFICMTKLIFIDIIVGQVI